MVAAPLAAARLPLGPYDLDDAIGVGGMGQVWSALHRDTGARVAIKVLTAFGAERPALRSAFRNEIRACAALDHPAIVQVFDRGEISEAVERRSRGRLTAGTPYLVMEFVGGGSLDDWCGHLGWREVRMVLLGVLDALAHAHARGLVHRDIKPANILLTEERDAIRLTDFGLVHTVETPGAGSREKGVAGTPRYMAPEQCDGRWRDYGPWTDFYALGGVAWALVCGHAPFADVQGHFELLRSQREVPFPPLAPKCEVPDGFEDWLGRMAAKDPAARFQRASEAARALVALGDPPQTTAHLSDSNLRATTLLGDATRFVTLLEGVADEDVTHLDDDETSDGHPSAFPEWLTAQGRTAPPHALVGASLGLYWLRPVPLVNREYEREELWDALRAVRDEGRARVVVLRGPAGVGKTRLGDWLCWRAHEVAGCDALRAGAAAKGNGGLAAMLARRFHTPGLAFDAVAQRVEQTLAAVGLPEPDFARAVAELIQPAHGPDLDQTRSQLFDNKWERLRLIQMVVRRLAASRPQVLWIDDAERSAPGLHLARELLREQHRRPSATLIVLGVQDERLERRPVEAELLEELLQLDGAEQIRLGPLGARDHQRLVRRLLRLSGELAMWVEERTAGNPQFAVQMVGDWVDRGLLELGPGGFGLLPGAELSLPEDLAAIWATRLASFLDARGVHDAPALELAAVLGRPTDEAAWWALCDQAGITPSLDLLDDLLDDGLARAGSGGPQEAWSLAHPRVRDALLDRAATAGRLAAHHRACARFQGFRGGPGASEAIAQHLVAAGDLAQALGPLAQGAWELIQAEELPRAQALLEAFADAVNAIDLPPGDARRGQALLLRVQLAARAGHDDELESWADWARAEADAQGWEHIAVYVAFEQANRSAAHGRFDEAATALERVAAWADRTGDRPLLGRCLHAMARLAAARGDVESARPFARSAAQHFGALQERAEAARATLTLAHIEARAGDAEQSTSLGSQARRLFAEAGSRLGPAEDALLAGDRGLIAGDLAGAAERYEAAARRFEALGSRDVRRAEAGLGLARALQGRFEEATPLLERSLSACVKAGEALEAVRIHASLLPVRAAAGAWPAFDEHFAQIHALAPAVQAPELRKAVQRAAHHALGAGQAERAAAALALAGA